MTDPEQRPRVLDEPGTPPIQLLGLITEAYTDALLRLAYAERDRHDWASYRKVGYDLIAVGARVVMHAYARREPRVADPEEVAAEAAGRLRANLRLAERMAENRADANSVAREIEALAEDCAETAGQLYQTAAGLSPAAVAGINPRGDDHDNVTDNQDSSEHSGGGPA